MESSLTTSIKSRAESKLQLKQAFERGAGWRFGLVTGLIIVLVGYGWDALQLASISVEYYWIKFLLAAVTILPLATLAGYIAGHFNIILQFVVWLIFGLVSAFFAIHIPFELARGVLQLFEPNLRVVELLAIPHGATDSTGVAMTLGALLGILVGGAQALVVGKAWEDSSDNHTITRRGWALLLLVIPLALAYAILFDGTINTPVRTPLQLVSSVIQVGLYTSPNLDFRQMETHEALRYVTASSWRDRLTPRYVMRLAAIEPRNVGQGYVDTTFDNGLNLRCETTTYGEFIGTCFDINARYPEYLGQFISTGTVTCNDCQVVPSAQVQNWQKQHAAQLGATDLFTIAHGAGSSVRISVTPQAGARFECLFSGADPILIEECSAL